MKKPIIVALIAFALHGCASSTLTPAQQTALVKQHASQKTLEFSCTGPCSLSYKDPRDKLTLPQSTNGYDVANTLINTTGSVALGAAPWAAAAGIAREGFRQSGDTITGSHNSDATHAPTVVTAPDPVIVNQPPPVVVQQPAPVIVQGVVHE